MLDDYVIKLDRLSMDKIFLNGLVFASEIMRMCIELILLSFYIIQNKLECVVLAKDFFSE
jgi:hypothetical protein